jgi:tetratricopeptide (TPR) repeat protein
VAKKKAAKKAAKAAAAPKAQPAAKKVAKPKATAVKKKAAKKAAQASESATSEKLQAEHYSAGVVAFQAGRIKRAIDLFEKVAEGPDAGLRHRAHVHIQICRRRTESDRVELATADDYYNYAVKLINDRRLDEAEEHLDKALKKATRAGYMHYAKAVVAALRNDSENAFRSLRRAVELDDTYRIQARRDPDLASVRDDAQIAELMQGDASGAD